MYPGTFFSFCAEHGIYVYDLTEHRTIVRDFESQIGKRAVNYLNDRHFCCR